MSVSSAEDFAKHVLSLAQATDSFKPFAYHNKDGDCIEFFAKPGSFKAERLDDLVTVYYSQRTGELSGAQIKGIKGIVRKLSESLPGLAVEIKQGKIRIRSLIAVGRWLTPKSEIDVHVYDRLENVADDTTVEAEFCLN